MDFVRYLFYGSLLGGSVHIVGIHSYRGRKHLQTTNKLASQAELIVYPYYYISSHFTISFVCIGVLSSAEIRPYL